MIYVITGRPRNGKSLYAVDTIQRKAEKENRQVYYTRIEGITFPNWTKLSDAKKWDYCPEGSIILFDEAHYDFPNRHATSASPSHVLPLNTHGHKGFDLYFITQDGQKFLDPNIRGLAQEHHHVVRHFGSEKATIHRWDSFKTNPDHKTTKQDSIKTKFTYPKHRYSQYQSSTHHNVVVTTPLKYKLLFIIPLIILGLLGKVTYSWFFSDKPKEQTPMIEQIKNFPEQPQIIQAIDQQPQKLSFIEANTPEIKSLPDSSPKYQAIDEPKQVPKPHACIASKKKCTCFTQQATLYDTSEDICRQIVKNGIFLDNIEPQQTQMQPLQPIEPIQAL